MIASKILLIGAAAAVAAAAWAAPASAQSPGYCNGVARSAADRQAGPTGVIGSFVGTIDAGVGYQGRWRAAYDAAYEACITTAVDTTEAPAPYVDNAYADDAYADAPDETVIVRRPAPPRTVVVEEPGEAPMRTVVVARPEPWTAAWYSYCADRYRSFNARTGTFTSYTGEAVFCR
ncbi:MAG: BA14K family protein [Parvibaculaceae bacterium]